jgi:hypothetical protein
MRRVKVTIVYKSGAKVKLRCKSFSVSRSTLDGQVTKLAWDDARPRPLEAGIDEIAAVWSRKVWRWWR